MRMVPEFILLYNYYSTNSKVYNLVIKWPVFLIIITLGGTNVVRERFASIHGKDNFTFVYEPGIGDTDIYPSTK